MFNITATPGSFGTILPLGVTSVASGEDQVYAIVPFGGYKVDDVLVDGVPQGDITSFTFTGVAADHTITATYSQSTSTLISQYKLRNDIDPDDPTSSQDYNGIFAKAKITTTANPAHSVFEIFNATHAAAVRCGPGYVDIGYKTYSASEGGQIFPLKHISTTLTEFWAIMTVRGDIVTVNVRGAGGFNESIEATLFRGLSFNVATDWKVLMSSTASNPGPSNTVFEHFQVKADDLTAADILIVYVTLTAGDVTNKYVQVALEDLTEVAVNLADGTAQSEGIDFVVDGNKIDWYGLGMEALPLIAGDILRIVYTEAIGVKNIQKIGKNLIGLE